MYFKGTIKINSKVNIFIYLKGNMISHIIIIYYLVSYYHTCRIPHMNPHIMKRKIYIYIYINNMCLLKAIHLGTIRNCRVVHRIISMVKLRETSTYEKTKKLF